ncbi:MAG: hypothetical protein OXG05_08745 [Gammaproteobacteria bacterium]|nr:hypothetical protein [Gammaproteobacteria bacterium]
MKVISCIVAVLLLGLAYYVRVDTLLVIALLTTSVLTFLTLFPSLREVFIRGFAFINMIFMFFYFYRFFTAVPVLHHRWYTEIEYFPIWIVLIGAFASMHVLADNSCCLKRELEDPVQLTIPRFWASSR